MTARIEITAAELLDALATERANAGPDEARTVGEIHDETGLSENHVRSVLKALQREGRLTVHRVRRLAIDGRMAQVAGYTIAPKKKKARAG